MNICRYDSKEDLARALSKEIAARLVEAIEQFGHAHLLVSGGSSPKPLFMNLSEADIPWNKVVVALVDERFVPVSHEKSNAKLLKEHLLINNATDAQFVGMVYDESSRSRNLELAIEAYSRFSSRIDVTVLGMGADGHTASLFPGDASSELALSASYEPLLANTQADVAPFERITCTRKLINGSTHLYLLINGATKREVLCSALENDLPIAAFFETGHSTLETYYTEES